MEDQNKNNINPMHLYDLMNDYLNKNDYDNYFDQALELIQYYIDNDDLENALTLSNSLIDNDIIKDYYAYYKELLDKYIYICIQAQNFTRAINFSNIKKDYININDKQEVNRWNIELAYLYDSIEDKVQSLRKLESVLVNDPDDSTKSYVLCNICKIYIDLEDFEKAQKAIDEAQAFAIQINDTEGVEYCNYLLGKLYRLEKKYNESQNIFRRMFKKDTQLDNNTFTYLNEYLNLLVENRSYIEGVEICEKYYDEVNASNNLQNKYDFYQSYLRIVLSYNNEHKKKTMIDSNTILDTIKTLEKEIKNKKNIKVNSLQEYEMFLELKKNEGNCSKTIEDNISYIKFITNGSLRNYIDSYAKSLTDKVPFDELSIVIFDNRTNAILDLATENLVNNINHYSYKAGRLYEREFSFNDLEGTLFKNVFSNISNNITIEDKETNNYTDIASKRSYHDLGYKYVTMFPLYNNDQIIGAIAYAFFNKNSISEINIVTLNIASKLFASNYELLLSNINNNFERGILSSTLQNLQLGTFYQIIDEKNIIHISSNLQKLLNLKEKSLTELQYTEIIYKSDLENYLNKYASINKKEPYKISYHIELNDGKESFLVEEQASPFLTIDNRLIYCGSIEKVELNHDILEEVDKSRELLHYQNSSKLVNFLENNRKSRFTGFVFSFNHLNAIDVINKEKVLENIYLNLKKFFNGVIYNDNNMFIFFTSEAKQREALKLCKDIFNNVKDVSSYTYISYPQILIRVDDFIEVARFLTRTGTGFIDFNNERYAEYIQATTISNCVNRAILSNNININKYKVSYNYDFIGYKITPNIKGVYNEDSLKVCNIELIKKLDMAMINIINDLPGVSFYNITLDSLVNIVQHKAINMYKDIIFILSDAKEINASDFNYCLKKLSKIHAKVAISEEYLKNITISSLFYYASVIYGINGQLIKDNELLLMSYNRNFIYLNNQNFKISKEVTLEES